MEQLFRETRAFRIYDGPSEVHRWSLARGILRRRAGSIRRVRGAGAGEDRRENGA